MVEAAASLGQSLILVKYLVFPVIPAGIKLKSVQKSTGRRVGKPTYGTRHPVFHF